MRCPDANSPGNASASRSNTVSYARTPTSTSSSTNCGAPATTDCSCSKCPSTTRSSSGWSIKRSTEQHRATSDGAPGSAQQHLGLGCAHIGDGAPLPVPGEQTGADQAVEVGADTARGQPRGSRQLHRRPGIFGQGEKLCPGVPEDGREITSVLVTGLLPQRSHPSRGIPQDRLPRIGRLDINVRPGEHRRDQDETPS